MPTILITRPEYRKAQTFFENASRNSDWRILPAEPDEAAFLEAIAKNHARLAIIGMVRYSEAVYQALAQNAAQTSPAVLSRFGVGTDNVNRDFARKWNVRLSNTPNVLNHSVAEHTIWLLGAAAKRLGQANDSLKKGLFLPQTGMELYGKKLLIAGLGGIGRETARIAHFGLGMNVFAFGRRSLKELSAAENVSPAHFLETAGLSGYSNRLEDFLPEADAVCVLLASSPETFHFFDARRLDLLRKNVLFVNTSRGALVDENALFDFLLKNPDAFASLDVFETEPYQPQDPTRDLRSLPNTFLTAHHASSTWDANAAIGRCALENTQKLAINQGV